MPLLVCPQCKGPRPTNAGRCAVCGYVIQAAAPPPRAGGLPVGKIVALVVVPLLVLGATWVGRRIQRRISPPYTFHEDDFRARGIAQREKKPLIVYTYDSRTERGQLFLKQVLLVSDAVMDHAKDFVWVKREYNMYELYPREQNPDIDKGSVHWQREPQLDQVVIYSPGGATLEVLTDATRVSADDFAALLARVQSSVAAGNDPQGAWESAMDRQDRVEREARERGDDPAQRPYDEENLPPELQRLRDGRPSEQR